MAKEIIRFIILYIICACVGACVQGCKSTKQTTGFEHVGKVYTAQTDSVKAAATSASLSSIIDTTDTEITWTRTEYDTERTDTDGTHPVKSVDVLTARKHTGRQEQHTQATTTEATTTSHESKEVVDSTKYERVAVTTRPLSSPTKLLYFLAVLSILAYFGVKYGRKFW